MPKKKSNAPSQPKPVTRTLKLKKKVVVKTGKPPAPGERKALRKRVVLSNSNALEVPDVSELSLENVADQSSIGSMMSFSGLQVDQLRAADAFKPIQKWSLFRKPSVLSRTETVEIAKLLVAHQGANTINRLYTGDRASGKSILLLQAMAMALHKEWVVISIPEAQDWTIAHSAYAPVPNTDPRQYIQPTLTASLLARIAKVNGAVLSTLQLSREHPAVPIPLQTNLSLDRLADLGARDPELAWPIFEALWAELTASATPKQTGGASSRPPVMVAIDGINHWMRNSAYRAADFSEIHAHDLTMIRHLTSYMSGERQLPNGGALLAATTQSNKPPSPTLALTIRQGEARARGTDIIPQASPFELLDQRVVDVMKNVDVVKLGGLSRREARGLLEYYAASGMLREKITEQLVTEKWTMAGGGIAGEVEKAAVVMGALGGS
ncbi:MAG: hypothetical protein M1825_004762 [Sarcosagium campestre]|nr:MAG: hypothetical protein M1825_004762 [Sarcosagium campestre]